nr:hypothetical protein [Tanacetum cinerariifolium]
MLVGVSFTGPEWERVCMSRMFSASKVIVISSDEYGGLFVGKSIHGFVSNTNVVTKNISGPCERSLYMSVKIYIDEWSKTDKNKNVQLVGEICRLKDVLELNVGDRMRFRLVFGNLTFDEALFFDFCKVV